MGTPATLSTNGQGYPVRIVYSDAPVVLNSLTLSPASIPVGAAATINITGKTAGSTLTTSTLMPTGMTFTGTQITGTPTAAGPVAIVIIETLTGADNSPKSNALTITVTE